MPVCSIGSRAQFKGPAELLSRVLLVALLSAGLLSGCFSSSPDKRCAKPKEYQKSSSLPELKIPEGLDAPERSGAITVPPASPNADGGVISDCLDRPPDYFRKEKIAN